MKLTCLIVFLGLFSATPALADGFNPAPLQQRAQAGDVQAQFELGTLDYTGLGVVQDYIGALDMLEGAGAAGNAEADCEVGFLYQTGSFAQGPPPPDPKDAAPWYMKAAAAGNACGEFGLATLYQTGQGVVKDPVKAAALYAQAAAQGLALDLSSFPLEQLQKRFYAEAYQLTGLTEWTDMVSVAAGGGS